MALIVTTWNSRENVHTELEYPDHVRAVVANESLILFDDEIEIDGFAQGFWTSFTRTGWFDAAD